MHMHLRLRKCEKLPQICRKLADLRLRNTSCTFAEFVVAVLSVNLRCPALLKVCPVYSGICGGFCFIKFSANLTITIVPMFLFLGKASFRHFRQFRIFVAMIILTNANLFSVIPKK